MNFQSFRALRENSAAPCISYPFHGCKDAFALADAGSQCEDRDDVLFCVWKFDRSGSLCDLF